MFWGVSLVTSNVPESGLGAYLSLPDTLIVDMLYEPVPGATPSNVIVLVVEEWVMPFNVTLHSVESARPLSVKVTVYP